MAAHSSDSVLGLQPSSGASVMGPQPCSGASVLGPPPTTDTKYPRPQFVTRQIRDCYWIMGEQCLEDNPGMNEIEVYFHHWNDGMRWEYKVARVNGVIVRQTWLNGNLVG